jgi:quercetin dioxygenase-like cupin family protein
MSVPTSTLELHRWAEIAPEPIGDAITRRYVSGERVTLARFHLKKGGIVPAHRHENEQVSYVVSGALEFRAEGRTTVVRGGEVLRIPPQLEHEVKVLEDSEVLDIFAPVRQDWIDGTDSYFRR